MLKLPDIYFKNNYDKNTKRSDGRETACIMKQENFITDIEAIKEQHREMLDIKNTVPEIKDF